ncbi:proteasome activator complex subunit 4-like isoform X1 [Dinothrombium tinctorium]|uniref:Proteasome activator complex subunit 4-like isoform X1 n=1 Tax=Dinothrombium tinctorium TaxID=1965070 RepID=A0A3S3PXP2_9ACAR|nr:proteasome activator complex subunit 4-like isoform X1 [Dinothrombium tinctorium]RWS10075.1 proteasome activator complex subunit 4-like isoform X1 [Dinothrombium tinctorium]
MEFNVTIKRTSIYDFTPQHEKTYNSFLPYSSTVKNETINYLKNIKANINRGIILANEDAYAWLEEFKNYLKVNGLCFPKSDHLLFIQLFFEILFDCSNVDIKLKTLALDILTVLIDKPQLISRQELNLDWRKPYHFCKTILECKNARIGLLSIPQHLKDSIYDLIMDLNIYFSPDSTAEMLDELIPHLCPFVASEMDITTRYLEVFLPLLMKPEFFAKGCQLWFDKLFYLWQTFQSPTNSWEQSLVSLFSRFSFNTIGYFDWNPHITVVFSRLHRCVSTESNSKLLSYLVIWIISMINPKNEKVLLHISHFFRSIEVNYHPNNGDEYNENFSQILTDFTYFLVLRLHWECYEKPCWVFEIHEEYKLTEQICDKLVKIILPLVLKCMFNEDFLPSAKETLHYLALISPRLVCSPMLRIFKSSVDAVDEPHRLVPTFECLSAIAISMVESGACNKSNELIHILDVCLLAIDINDMDKCKAALKLVQTIFISIPTLNEHFDEFAMKFIDKLLKIVNDCNVESWTKSEGIDSVIYVNDNEHDLNALLSNTLSLILEQCTNEFFDKILDKFFISFSRSIYEPLICGKMVSNLCRALVMRNAEKTVAKFLPHFADIVFDLTEEEKCYDENNLDDRLIFALCIISSVCACRGRYLISFQDKISKIIERGLRMKSIFGYTYICSLIRRILVTSTNVFTSNSLCKTQKYEFVDNPIDIAKIKITWSIPNEEDIKFSQSLLETVLTQELNSLEQWTNGELTLSKDECQKKLTTIYSCIFGASSSLPSWIGGENEERHSPIDFDVFKEIGSMTISFSNGENVRKLVALKMHKILHYILSKRGDDITSICTVIDIIDVIITLWGAIPDEIQWLEECIEPLKFFLKNQLIQNKKYVSFMHIKKANKQQERRLGHRSIRNFTSLHGDLLNDLILLIINHYEEVRKKAINLLRYISSIWCKIYQPIVPQLLIILKDKQLNDEQFEGILNFLLQSNSDEKHSLLFSTDWNTLKKLWIAFLSTNFSDKPSVVTLIDSLNDRLDNEAIQLPFSLNVSQKCVELAHSSWNYGVELTKNSKIESNEIVPQRKLNDIQNNENQNFYKDFSIEISRLIKIKNLHWKYNEIAFSLLYSLIRPDISQPHETIKILVENLNNDSLKVRKKCISAVSFILQQQKKKHQKVVISSLNQDSLQYQLNVNYLDENIWQSTTFIEKPFWGFYAWPKTESFVYKYEDGHHFLNESLTEFEAPIFEFFSNPKQTKKFIKFLCIEESKGNDFFDEERYLLFKRLFRNFGISLLKQFEAKIPKLVESEEESDQRCACELITGLIRGSKNWTLRDTQSLSNYLTPILRSMINKMTIETYEDWTILCATVFRMRDSRKLCWFIELMINCLKPVNKKKKKSFRNLSLTQCLFAAISEQKWRSLLLLQNLLEQLIENNHLIDHFADVRVRIGLLLNKIFSFDIDLKYCGNALKYSPNSRKFFTQILEQLKVIENRQKLNESDREKSVNLLKTVMCWILSNTISDPYPLQPHYFEILPILCEVYKDSKDDDLIELSVQTLCAMSKTILTQTSAPLMFNVWQRVISSKSWRTRLAAAAFLKDIAETNVIQMKLLSEKLLPFIYLLLEDDRIEVQTVTASTLSSFIQNGLFDHKQEKQMIGEFKRKSEIQIEKIQSNSGTINNPKQLISKHFGILGLCSFVNAFPFDVPDFIPDILIYLSKHLHSPQPLRTTIKDTFNQFRRTHFDNWREHRLKFTPEQLSILNDLLVSSNYYA